MLRLIPPQLLLLLLARSEAASDDGGGYATGRSCDYAELRPSPDSCEWYLQCDLQDNTEYARPCADGLW